MISYRFSGADVFGRYPYAHAVSVVPNIVGVYEDVSSQSVNTVR